MNHKYTPGIDETCQIRPRDYGILVPLGRNNKLFLSPVKYALAALMLETQEQIQQRVESISSDESLTTLEERLQRRVKAVNGSKNLLRKSKRQAIQNTRLEARTLKADITSRNKGTYQITLKPFFGAFKKNAPNILGYQEADCQCPDHYELKSNELVEMCAHLALADSAFYADNVTRKSQSQNLTALRPKNRPAQAKPFLFNNSSIDHITNVLRDFYVGTKQGRRILRKNHFELDKEMLEDSALYSQVLLQKFFQRYEARFIVVRQHQITKPKEDLSYNEQRINASIRNVETQVTRMLKDRGFYTNKYSLEFRGTEHEVVAQRFIHPKTSRVISLCIKDDMPPVLVERYLGDRPNDWITQTTDSRQDSPYQRLGQLYESIDDSTRRLGPTKIIIPGTNLDSQVKVSQELKEFYNQHLPTENQFK
jgi:hypothetical protein